MKSVSRARMLGLLTATPLLGVQNRVATAQNVVTVQVGILNTASEAPLYIAADEGFFAKHGIRAEFVNFLSASDMVAPMGTGQLAVGAGGLSAGLYNAIARGIKIKAVADKITLRPGSYYLDLVVRKDLVESGRFKRWQDLKGLRIAEAGRETASSYALAMAAKDGGLTYRDFEHPSLGFPDQLVALQNNSIDAGVNVEPILTKMLDTGIASEVKHLDVVVPNLQVSVLLYSEAFAKNTELAQRFMNAYIEGARYYADAVRNGKLDGPTAANVIAILIKYTPLKDAATYRHVAPSELDADGRMNLADMRSMLRFFQSQGWITGNVTVEDLVDTSFISKAVKVLGPYKPRH